MLTYGTELTGPLERKDHFLKLRPVPSGGEPCGHQEVIEEPRPACCGTDTHGAGAAVGFRCGVRAEAGVRMSEQGGHVTL